MATKDIRFNQIGGGCGSSAGLYTAYALEKSKEEIEGDSFMGDWKNVIPVGSFVNVFTGNEGAGTGGGIYIVANVSDNINMIQIAARPKEEE